MNKTKSMLTVLGAAALMMTSPFMAQGQNFRTFVSGTGSDGNTGSGCLQTAPCRTFAAAIGVTNAGGQVVALDSTGYSGFSINKSITIEGAPGATAFIFVGAGATGVTVTGVSTDMIVLRNLYVDGLGNASTTGLSHTTAAKLAVQNCTFRSLTTGVEVSTAKMDIINSDFYNNGTGVHATGHGTDGNNEVSTALVRVAFGNNNSNNVGIQQDNPGRNGANNQLSNVWVLNVGSGGTLNLVGNTLNAACSDPIVGCLPLPALYTMGSTLK